MGKRTCAIFLSPRPSPATYNLFTIKPAVTSDARPGCLASHERLLPGISGPRIKNDPVWGKTGPDCLASGPAYREDGDRGKIGWRYFVAGTTLFYEGEFARTLSCAR